MKSVDYSDRAVTQRLRQVAQLRRLCLSLMTVKPRKEVLRVETTQSPGDGGKLSI